MKKRLIVSGIVAALMLASAGVGAYAATKMTLIVNGKVARAEPRVINGTTYVPVRAAAELLGAKVNYDSKMNTVTITSNGTSSPSSNSKPSTSTTKNSKSSPSPIGKQVIYNVDDILDKYTAAIKVVETIRGEEAWGMIEEANMFNDPAPDGYEYLLAKITFKVVSNKKSDATVSVSSYNFTLISSKGKASEHPMVVAPDPTLDADLYAGASTTGWAAFLVEKTDKAPLLSFGTKYDGTGGAWFKL